MTDQAGRLLVAPFPIVPGPGALLATFGPLAKTRRCTRAHRMTFHYVVLAPRAAVSIGIRRQVTDDQTII